MTKHLTLLLLGGAIIAAPALAKERPTPEAQLQKALAGRTAGKPVDCIPLTRNESSQVIEGKALIYKVGSTLYVNEPRSGAEILNDDDILTTRTFTSQLCRSDAVNLVQRFTGIQQGFVLLGQFVPYTKDKPAG